MSAPTWPAASMLGRLPSGPREALLRAGTEVRFRAREMLLQQGTRGDSALLLVSGRVKIVSDAESGESPLLAIRVRGDLIGEMATLDERPRSATVVAATTVTARRIGKARFTELVREHPEIGRAIVFIAHERLRWANRRRVDFLSYPPRTCLARVLVEIADMYGEPCPEGVLLDVSLTQADIASLAGARLSTTEKALRNLQSDGLILKSHRRITITDLTGLRTVAQITDAS